jgi:hypothetical protein
MDQGATEVLDGGFPISEALETFETRAKEALLKSKGEQNE